MESFMYDYRHSSDKEQFLKDKKQQCVAICEHAYQCTKWQRAKASEHMADLEARREARAKSWDMSERMLILVLMQMQSSCFANVSSGSPIRSRTENGIGCCPSGSRL
ncbi:hypothetical protein OG21DRAFT_581938 [Imleria badia]|nr:hypothetical protein OG21DRAFT_581938 [Imleria badia]